MAHGAAVIFPGLASATGHWLDFGLPQGVAPSAAGSGFSSTQESAERPGAPSPPEAAPPDAEEFPGVFVYVYLFIEGFFVQAPGDYFDADPTFKQSYAPQSGQIFGILKQSRPGVGGGALSPAG